MKKILILFILTNFSIKAQRYLTYVYPNLDSVIAGTYGNSTDYLGNNQTLLFDYYTPSLDTANYKPLIIYIHGGGFTSGTRDYPSVKLLCRKMAQKGYAVATIDYRLDPNFQLYNSSTNRRAMTDAMQDAKQAIRYFKANASLYKIDTNKVFIGGESAGAITSMMASFVDKQVEMLPYPMANPNNPIGSSNNLQVSNDVKGTLCLCGMILDTTAIENATNPPILWTHGTADSFIPISLSFNIVLRALHINLPIQTAVYQGATHCPWYYGNPNWQTYLDSTINDITTFLYPKVTTITSINDFQENNLLIYPNPTSENVAIHFSKTYENINITITTLLGQSCKSWNFKNTNRTLLQLSNFERGVYIVAIQLNNSATVTKKIVVN